MRLLWLMIWLSTPWAMAQEHISITLVDQPRYLSTSPQTIEGQVDPIDAAVTLNGAPVAVDGSGHFSASVTLSAGLNTFVFRASSEGLADATAKRDLFLDTEAPDLQITSPVLPHLTNESLIHIYGTVRDLDPQTVLERDGTEVAVENGHFVDTLTDLPDGEHNLIYEARDSLGHQSQIEVTLVVDSVAPALTLNTPATVAPNGSFPVSFCIAPAEDARQVTLEVANQVVYQANDGTSFAQDFTHDGSGAAVPVALTVIDRFGNRVQDRVEIPVARPNFLYGRVLDDKTSLPLAGIPLTISSPAGQENAVTAADGLFTSTLAGEPLIVTTDSVNHVRLGRKVAQAGGGYRLTDLRLTARRPTQSSSLPFVADDVRVTLTGFGGGVRVTPFGGQGLPALLPTGYVPLAGFELADASGSGDATLVAPTRGSVPVGAASFLLRAEASGWRVLQAVIVAGSELQVTASAIEAGSYLVAYRDLELETEPPQVGDLLERVRFQLVGEAHLYQASTDPQAVSLIDEPNTQVALLVQGQSLRSGALARIEAQEFHQRFSGDLRPPAYGLDVFCYRHGYASGGARHLRGALDVTSRESVSLETTRYAQIRFQAEAGWLDQGGYRFDSAWNLGAVSLDLGAQDGTMRAVRILSDDDRIPPLGAGASLVKAFAVDLDRDLVQAPTITVTEPESPAMIFLAHRDGERWSYAGRLTFSDGVWSNAPATTDMEASGHYAVVALQYPITEVSGTVRHGSNPASDVSVGSQGHPWLGWSDAQGSYRTFVPRVAHLWTLQAVQAATGLTASRELPEVTGLDALVDQDLTLDHPELALVAHQPIHNQQHVDLMPDIRLEFSHLIAFDPDLWVQAITLTPVGGGSAVPLQMLEDTEVPGLRIRPRQTLQEATDYRLQVGTTLVSTQGGQLPEPAVIEFRTLTRAVVGELDLTRFSLSWESERMYLEAPADAYPDRTMLSVLNPVNAYSLSETMVAGGYRREIEAKPGDVVHLSATLPNGELASASLDVVRTGPNRVRLGSQGFRYEVAPGLVLNVEGVSSGAGTELEITAVDEASMRATVSESPTTADFAPDQVLKGVQFETVDGSPLPGFRGFIETDIDPATQPDSTMILYSFQVGVQAPADPLALDELTSHTFGEPQGGHRIENGGLVGKRKSFNLKGLGFEYNIPGKGRGASLRFAILADQSGAEHYIYRVRTLREDVRDRQFEIDMLWADEAHWFIPRAHAHPGEDTPPHYPIREALVYRVDPDYDGVNFTLVGLTWADASYSYVVQGKLVPSLRVVDPRTGVMGEVTGMTSLLNGEGFVQTLTQLVFAHYAIRAAYLPFDIREPGEVSQTKLELEWRVIDWEDGQAEVNDWATAEFNARGRFARADNRSLRIEIKSSQALEKVLVGGSWFNSLEVKGETSSRQITVDLPQGMTAAESKHQVDLRITDLKGQEQRFVRDIWALGNFGDLPSLEAVPPSVVGSVPKHQDEDMLIREPLILYFSEPVRGVADDTVVLHDQARGDEAPLLYLSADGLEVTEQQYVDTLMIVPQASLNIDTEYRLRVEGLTDHDNDTLIQTAADGSSLDYHEIRFKTQESRPESLLDLEDTDQVRSFAAYRNLLLMAEPAEETRGVTFWLKLLDTRVNSGGKAQVVASSPVTGGYEGFGFDIEIFTPDALGVEKGFESTVMGVRNQVYAGDLPTGTLIVVKAKRIIDGSSRLYFFEYQGRGAAGETGPFRRITILDPPGTGVLTNIGRSGPYLALGFIGLDAVQDGEQNVIGSRRGSTRVYDMRDYMARVRELGDQLANHTISLMEYTTRLQALGEVMEYFYPGDPGDLEGFLWKNREGPQPGLLAAAISYPGLLRVDALDHREDAPFFTGQFYDFRNIARTLYPTGSGFPAFVPVPDDPGRAGRSRRRCFAIENLDLLTEGSLVTRDIAVFAEMDFQADKGYLYLYEVPDTADIASELKPRLALVLKNGYRHLAVDRGFGFIAVQDLGNRVSVLDVRALWTYIQPNEQPTVIELGEQHPAMVVDPFYVPPMDTMFFHDGGLYWAEDVQGSGLERLQLAPVKYRRVGWNTYDLSAWMNDDDADGDVEDRLIYPRHTVLYATDMFDPNDQALAFVMEIGSFELELEAGESATVIFREKDGSWSHTVEGEEARVTGMAGFNTVPLMEYLRDDKKDDLRGRGVWPFEVEYTIYRNHKVIAGATHDFLVAYQSPQTRYIDGFRQLGPIDALAQYPLLLETDHGVSHRDARLDLSPSRMLASDFMFQRGIHGMGMLNGQMLHMAYPAWWSLENFPSGFHQGDRSRARLVFEHPGQFQVSGSVSDDGRTVDLSENETNQFTLESDGWRLQHQENMWYEFQANAPLPQHRALFRQLNEHLTDDPDAAEKMRYPLFRYPESEKMPASLYREAQLFRQMDQPWNNQIKFQSGTGSGEVYPTLVKEITKDEGRARRVNRSYAAKPIGVFVEEVNALGMTISYAYDDDGYLTSVVQDPTGQARTTEYAWEETGFEAGDFVLKRLSKIIHRAAPSPDLITHFEYTDSDRPLRVTQYTTPFGLKDVTTTPSIGLPETVRIQGVAPAPTQEVTFAEQDGLWLSSGHSVGEQVFGLVWTRNLFDGERYQWLLAENKFRDQFFSYNGLGDLTEHHRDGGKRTWTYEGPEWFTHVPTGHTDPLEQTFTTRIEVSSGGGTITHGDGTVTTVEHLSGSGVAYRTTDHLQMERGGETTVNYVPDGDNYRAENGRITEVKVAGIDGAVTEYRHNRFGEAQNVTDLGVRTEIVSRDGVGRPTVVRTGTGDRVSLSYSFDNGLAVTRATYEVSGITQESSVDEWGRPYREEGTTPEGSVSYQYRYDDLGRLSTRVDEQDAGNNVSYQYHGRSGVLARVIGSTESYTFHVGAQVWNPSISGLTIQTGQKTRDEVYEVDALGRQVRGTMAQVGPVTYEYTGFGLLKRVGDAQHKGVTYEYRDKQVMVTDDFRELHTITTVQDRAGLRTHTKLSGNGLDVNAIDVQQDTGLEATGAQGMEFATSQRNLRSGIERSSVINGKGGLVRQSLNDYKVEGASFNRFGTPTQVEGLVQESFEFDDLGRLSGLTTANGQTLENMAYDARGRLTGYRNLRGKEVSMAYLEDSLRRASVEVEGKSRLGGDRLETYAASDTTSSSSVDWMGSRIERETVDPNGLVRFTRPEANGKAAATADLHFDGEKGVPTRYTDFTGLSTDIDWRDYGRTLMVTHPDNSTEEYRYSGMGDLRSYRRNGEEQVRIQRDAENRIDRIDTPTASYDWEYENAGPLLLGITGGRYPIAFGDHNHQGLPGSIDLGDGRYRIDLQYHPGGNPSCVVFQAKGGLPLERHYDGLGDLTYQRRGLEQATTYTYNSWGAPATMRIGTGPELTLFGEGDQFTLNLPGGTVANINEVGQVQTITPAGLQTKTYGYDAGDRLDSVRIGQRELQRYEYGEQTGQVSKVTVTGDLGAEVIDFGYDTENGRLTQVTRDGQLLAEWTYKEPDPAANRPVDPDRIDTYTDGNSVVTRFEYDDAGRTTTIDIQTGGGPTFHFSYDESGQMTAVSAMGMSAQFEDYDEGWPARMTWGNGIGFDIAQEEGRLQSITQVGGDLGLSLTWLVDAADADCATQDLNPSGPMITGVGRSGPGWSESWSPTYDAEKQLDGITITRTTPAGVQTIEETYGPIQNKIASGLVRHLNEVNILNQSNTRDTNADGRRVLDQTTGLGDTDYVYDPDLGNLTQIGLPDGAAITLKYDGFRRLREIANSADGHLETYTYDQEGRRLSAATRFASGRLVFAYHESRVIAIGTQEWSLGGGGQPEPSGEPRWTHAIGHGPWGPVFMKDLTGGGYDYYILTDHLGTPFAYHAVGTGTVYYTPYNPWGELLASHPDRGPPYAAEGSVPTEGFALPGDPVFPFVPLGLGGHLYEHDTGLVYMHHRFYHPRLGHFINPDFRAPDIYDPTTFTEPYAYAAGNPVLFMDPDGLKITIRILRNDSYDSEYLTFSEADYEAMREGSPFVFKHDGQEYFVEGGIAGSDVIKRQEAFTRWIGPTLFGSGTYRESSMENVQRDAMMGIYFGLTAPLAAKGMMTSAGAGITAGTVGSIGTAYVGAKGASMVADAINGGNTSKEVDQVFQKVIIPHAASNLYFMGVGEAIPSLVRVGRPATGALDQMSLSGYAKYAKQIPGSSGPQPIPPGVPPNPYRVWGKEFKWRKDLLPLNQRGVTQGGEVKVRFDQKGKDLIETLDHEGVHYFFYTGNEIRDLIGDLGYTYSSVLKYTEEALAEGYAKRSVWTGLKYPFIVGDVHPVILTVEGSAWIYGIYFTREELLEYLQK
ncbi:hypothetical protein SCOR_33985 [Sulfidibacter corallicola]|uniref:SbsA Ig-like domain-containing protein n=1 Tax=Sulfidibacter corallicola TaxID=2818388 RepID=A0A8A4TJX7_SULCO|nr:RHS repeat-associated core domain-containing protein [Sulfidibacter corallicola]QTD49452.1 hypothetical protein J3U87_28025 [Sulfidibacter corallicola]